MDLHAFNEIAGSYGIFCALFIAMLYWQIKSNYDSIKRYEDREEKLIERFRQREEALQKEAKEEKKEFLATLKEYKDELSSIIQMNTSFKQEIERLSAIIEKLYDKFNAK